MTGASTANLAIILLDARKGVIEQTKRHAFIASLLKIPHLVVCMNKMDLVDYSEEIFNDIRKDFQNFASKFDVQDIIFTTGGGGTNTAATFAKQGLKTA